MTTLNTIADEVATYFHIDRTLARAVASEIFEKLIEHAAIDDPVSVQSFGTFRAQFQQAKYARNPQTGGQIHVPAKWKMHWSASPRLGERLNKMISEQQQRRRA